jgi:hypothetical protein
MKKCLTVLFSSMWIAVFSYAGTVSTDPKDDQHKIIVGKDDDVTFTASPDSGSVTTSLDVTPSGPTTSDQGNSQVATFSAGSEGKEYTCKFHVTHTVGSMTCTNDGIFTYNVIAADPQVSDESKNKKWYYFENPSAPEPSDAEVRKFYVKGGIAPQDKDYEWSLDPNIGEVHEGYPGSTYQYVKIKSTGSGDVKITVKWDGREVGSIDETIRKYGNIQLISQPWIVDQSINWLTSSMDTNAGYTFTDDQGDPLANIGVNEQLTSPTSVYAGQNWASSSTPSHEANNTLDDDGNIIDDYGIWFYSSGATPTMVYWKDSGYTTDVFSKQQTYHVGSLSSGDGVAVPEHKVFWCRGQTRVEM